MAIVGSLISIKFIIQHVYLGKFPIILFVADVESLGGF